MSVSTISTANSGLSIRLAAAIRRHSMPWSVRAALTPSIRPSTQVS